jgi:DNA-binding FrmR family transcriptional regulator
LFIACQIPNGVFDIFGSIYYYDFIQLKVEEITMHYDKKMINRINRIQGQLNGVIKMMEEEKDCKDVITQISASKSSIQRLMGIIISENLIECVKTAEDNGENSEELINEAVNLLVKSK